MKTTKRQNAILSGVNNAVDTVIVDKAMTADEAYRMLDSFVQDGMNSHGLDDVLTAKDRKYARDLWPLSF
jgi:hypothetical protein